MRHRPWRRRQPSRVGLLAAPVGVLLGGCAANLSNLVDPETTPPKKVHLNVGWGLYAPLGPVAKVVDAGIYESRRLKELADSGQTSPMTEEEQRKLIKAGVAIALQPPSATWEIQARTGIVNNLDVGFRYSVTQLRADARYRLFHSERWAPPDPEEAGAPEPSFGRKVVNALKIDKRLRSYDATLQVGVAYFFFTNPLFEALEFLQMGDFSRWDVDASLVWGFDIRRIFKFYAGPKFIYTRFSLDERLYDISKAAAEWDERVPVLTESVSHNMFYYGGLVGIAAGYKWVFVFLELNGGYTYARPVVFGERRDIGGVTLYPTVAIAAKFP